MYFLLFVGVPLPDPAVPTACKVDASRSDDAPLKRRIVPGRSNVPSELAAHLDNSYLFWIDKPYYCHESSFVISLNALLSNEAKFCAFQFVGSVSRERNFRPTGSKASG